MTRTSYDMVREFHVALDHPVSDVPGPITDERLRLRMNLIMEEAIELLCDMTGQDRATTRKWRDVGLNIVGGLVSTKREANIVGVADNCCDLHYVVSGTAIEFGIPEDEVYELVHKANMAKSGGPKREDGKTLRPPDWQPPDDDIEVLLDVKKSVSRGGASARPVEP